MNLRRRALVGWGRVADHASGALDAPRARASQDEALAAMEDRINEAYASVPPAPPHDPELLEFLHRDCRMVLEHADGSFMDHLQFGYEYAAAHFPGHSPRVLLLHSIMGLGSNHFPMEASKIPRLRSLVTDFEMRHIEAFPSLVRLWCHGRLPAELLARSGADLSQRLRGISFRRVMDNRELWLDAQDLWVQLNYHLIHYLDFLPVSRWSTSTDARVAVFRIYCSELRAVLASAGKLMARVDFEPALAAGEIPEELRTHRRMSRWEKISGKIGHSLEYAIQWADGAAAARPRL